VHRYGVFAREIIHRGELIAMWGGYVMTTGQVERLPREIQEFDYPVQIYEGLFLGPRSADDLDGAEMFNHSCEPNAGIKGQIMLVARRDIELGEEICFDYETTDSEEMWMLCNCGTPSCRHVINGEAWKDAQFQTRNAGYFSWYLQEKIERYNQRKMQEVSD
jgi:uncharacterized protein